MGSGPSHGLDKTQRLTAALADLDVALASLLEVIDPVAPSSVPLAEALGCIAAGMPPLSRALPLSSIAVIDGWALRARELSGASSYSPLPLKGSPIWVEAGQCLPEDCDCVLDADLVENSGPMVQILADAVPGQGVRRVGEDIAEGRTLTVAGQRVGERDLLVARIAGLSQLAVRRPQVHVINVPATAGGDSTAQLVGECLQGSGARLTSTEASGRDVASITNALEAAAGDLLILIGGTGVGRTDATIDALTARGKLLVHGIALSPGRTTGIGWIAGTPVVAVPGAPAHALATWWTVVQPVLDRLTCRKPRRKTVLPVLRKISSSVGVTEIVLLEQVDSAWMPLSIADLSLDHIARADAWLAVPGDSEGYAAKALVGAYPLRDDVGGFPI
jgi:molybdopterin molybdotransferase